MYSITIIHPSRNRPKQADETIKKWRSNAFYPEYIEYILSVDKDDRDLRRYKAVGIENHIYVAVNRNKSAIEAINNAAKVSTANLIIVVSDDFDCPKNWDLKLKKELAEKEDYLVKTQDGIQKTLITLPIMDRTYYNRFGYIYHPDYKHMFSDQEMTAVGHLLGRVITLDLMFPHNHYSTGKSRKDSINTKNNMTWNQGSSVFAKRLRGNFGIESPIIDYNQIQWK